MSAHLQAALAANPTLHPSLRSWLACANEPGCDFPIQNLPFGVFAPADGAPRVGVAIGNLVLDLAALQAAGLLSVPGLEAGVFAQASLNAFIGLGPQVWRALRSQLSALLAQDTPTLRDDAALRAQALHAQNAVRMLLPVEIPGYTDFYSSKEHATNVGCMFRDPKNALLPNWLEIPIGYNGRASSVVVSGTPIHRPMGQIKGPTMERPVLAPCGKLDFELETGFIIGRATALGDAVPLARAEEHIFGMVLLNDWSARDIQAWEYVPLGPFNAKTFGTTISPWVVTMEALEPFRVMQPQQEPQPLAYLHDGAAHGFDIALEVDLQPGYGAGHTICRTNFKHMYWSMAQQLTHHTVSGCNLKVGDLMGSGTISGPDKDAFGSLLELTWNGANPLRWGQGDGVIERKFLEDGDTLIMRGWCDAGAFRIGFGECSGQVLPVK
ncbi:fumarylacetoacetase [Massilia sp. W12]|uniref:fumarylacetoacetase n=1 Tax=Massilia sp. W12 TaxID=3126507 RepID=UPI0030CEF0AA